MWNDNIILIRNLYGMAQPDPKYMKERMKKVKDIISKMGNKYCLYESVERKDG